MNRFKIIPAALALLFCFGAAPAFAQDEIRSERVQFKKGAASAVIKGRLKGHTSVEHEGLASTQIWTGSECPLAVCRKNATRGQVSSSAIMEKRQQPHQPMEHSFGMVF